MTAERKQQLYLEWQRSFSSLYKSPMPAVILFQAAGCFFVASKGAGRFYMDMLGLLIGISLFSWVLTAYVQGNEKIVLYTILLLTVGTMLQCIFLAEYAAKTGSAPSVVGLQVQYLTGFILAVVTGALYRKFSQLAAMKTVRLAAGAGIALSIVTLLLSGGHGGVKNWIILGGISIQTTELLKLFYIMIAAGLLGRREKIRKENMMAFFLITGCFMLMLAVQGEFGTLLLICLMFLSLLFLFAEDIRVFLTAFSLFGLLTAMMACLGVFLNGLSKAGNVLGTNPAASFFLRNWNKIANRFVYWLHPEKDALGLGYQLLRARESIVLGGFFGTSSLTELPVKTSDLVYPALIQRCGIVFALLVFMLFIFLWLEGVRIYIRKNDRYHQVIGASCAFLMFFQTMIIVAGSTGLCPLTGITLPFISSGGSSLAVSLCIISLMISVSGNVPWKGMNNDDEEIFIKENQVAAGILSRLRHSHDVVSHKNLSNLAGYFRSGRPGKENSKGKGPRKRIYKGKHSGQRRRADRLV